MTKPKTSKARSSFRRQGSASAARTRQTRQRTQSGASTPSRRSRARRAPADKPRARTGLGCLHDLCQLARAAGYAARGRAVIELKAVKHCEDPRECLLILHAALHNMCIHPADFGELLLLSGVAYEAVSLHELAGRIAVAVESVKPKQKG